MRTVHFVFDFLKNCRLEKSFGFIKFVVWFCSCFRKNYSGYSCCDRSHNIYRFRKLIRFIQSNEPLKERGIKKSILSHWLQFCALLNCTIYFWLLSIRQIVLFKRKWHNLFERIPDDGKNLIKIIDFRSGKVCRRIVSQTNKFQSENKNTNSETKNWADLVFCLHSMLHRKWQLSNTEECLQGFVLGALIHCICHLA